MNKGFSIGEMSKLHKIPIKTLRYYDEINLFKPHYVDERNGYRYYAIDQFEQLNTINYLKSLNIPLKEICEHIRVANLKDFTKLLDQELHLTEERIRQLEKNKKQLQQRLEDIKSTSNVEMGKVYYKQYPTRFAYSIETTIISIEDIELTLRRLTNVVDIQDSIMIGQVGLMVSQEAVLNDTYHGFNRLLVFKEEVQELNPYAYELNAGYYATLMYRGADHMESPRCYKILKESICSMGYQIVGDSIERVIIDDHLTINANEFVTEIQIPIIMK